MVFSKRESRDRGIRIRSEKTFSMNWARSCRISFSRIASNWISRRRIIKFWWNALGAMTIRPLKKSIKISRKFVSPRRFAPRSSDPQRRLPLSKINRIMGLWVRWGRGSCSIAKRHYWCAQRTLFSRGSWWVPRILLRKSAVDSIILSRGAVLVLEP